MPEKGVTIVPFKKVVIPERNENLLHLLQRSGAHVDSPCGGKGICGKCLVQVKVRGKYKVALACRTIPENGMKVKPHTSDVFVETAEEGKRRELEIEPPFDIISKVFKGRIQDGIYGLAIDLGTTTIVLSLVNIKKGKEIRRISFQNPQVFFGGDVMTRIAYCMEREDGTETLRRVLLEEMNKKINQLVNEEKEREGVILASLTGNPTMLHIFMGLNPEPLGLAPYRTVFNGDVLLKAEETGISLKGALFYIPPFPSAYIGADITAGITVSGMLEEEENSLFIDLGTNAEMVLKKKDGKLFAVSSPAGPVFEGYKITCGLRAVKGAINDVKLKEGEIIFETIGNVPPRGICGSGLINAIGELLKEGIIERTGRFNEDGMKEYIKFYDAQEKHFYISRKKNPVFISQKDVREFQLAKSAIRSGIEILCRKGEISFEEINSIYIAGGLGKGVRKECLEKTGIIPELKGTHLNYIGNSSIEGAKALLLSRKIFETIRQKSTELTTLNLSEYPEFQEIYISFLNF